jgi:flagella basal body P-ring formation protein FlgA
MRNLLLVSCLYIAATQSAMAVQLRPYVALSGDQVRLSDLFDGLPAGRDRTIGPGPPPGGQIIVAAAQLNAIAGQFDVDWHDGSGAAHAILQRSGTPMNRAALNVALKTALADQGAPGEFEVELIGYAPPLVAPNDTITPLVGALQYNQATGDFSALITITGDRTPAQSLRVSGNVAETAAIPVLARLLPVRQPIEAGDIKMITTRLPRDAANIARTASQLIGQALRHVVPAGAPMPLSELTTPTAVLANASVEMDLETGGLHLAGRGIAEQSGAVGDMIRVRNPSSLAVMMAEVTGHDRVRVDPDSQPIVGTHHQEFAAR